MLGQVKDCVSYWLVLLFSFFGNISSSFTLQFFVFISCLLDRVTFNCFFNFHLFIYDVMLRRRVKFRVLSKISGGGGYLFISVYLVILLVNVQL